MIKSENIKTNVFNSNIYNSFLIQIFFSSTGLPLYLETWKNMEFENLGKKTIFQITWQPWNYLHSL